MKNKIFICAFIIILIILGIISYVINFHGETKKKIAVVTTLSHPALNLVRAGFENTLKARANDYELVFFNAEGSIQSANLIARQIAQDQSFAAILAIASLATQTLAKTIHDRPIVITAVSDPKSILAENAHNICGLSDAIDADFQISTILDLLPETKTISLLYSPHESNSSSVVQKLKQSIEKHNLSSELIGVYEPQQIPSASMKACKNDLILIPLDNQLAASMPAIIKATHNLSCTVVLTDKALLKYGAAIAFGIDYEQSGKEAAEIMLKILQQNIEPSSIGISNTKDLDIFINRQIIEKKNIIINPEHKTKIIYSNEK